MFTVAYHQGETFDSSYFVGRDGEKVRVVNAARVIPPEVMSKIAEAEAKGVEAADVLAPEEAVVEIQKSCGSTFEGFETWAAALPALTREADLKREAEWALNEGEIPKVEMPKKGEVISSIPAAEAKAGEQGVQEPTSRGSKVKQYYGRLPSKTMGVAEQGLNPQSSINDKYQMLKKALDDEKVKTDMLSKEKDKMGEELGKMKEEKEVDKKQGSIGQIMTEVKKDIKDPEALKKAEEILSKITPKDLPLVLELLKLEEGEEMGGAKGPMAPKAPGFPGKAIGASLIGGQNLPSIAPSTEGSPSLLDVVSKMMDHN